MNGLCNAVVIGIAFGATLECAGLGDPPKLAGQFYLRDFTVLKVMLTAMLTAMLGTFWLGRMGVVDVSGFYVPDTFVLPQLVGGLLFGAGFVLSGLCPGTSCVALASGRRAGAATMAGLFGGMLLFGTVFPLTEPLYRSTAQGPLTLPQWLGWSPGSVVALVTAAGIAMLGWIAKREARS